MPMASDSLVLIVEDAGLRSTLAARLGLAGETVHIAATHEDPALVDAHGKRAILIVEETRLPPGALDDARDTFWPGPIIILGDQIADEPSEASGIVRIDRRSAAQRVADQVSALRGREAGGSG